MDTVARKRAGALNISASPEEVCSDTAYGVEMNFNCGLIQSPDNRIRTHLSISRVDGNSYDATIIELSPRYTVPLSHGFSIGAGPSLGARSPRVGTLLAEVVPTLAAEKPLSLRSE